MAATAAVRMHEGELPGASAAPAAEDVQPACANESTANCLYDTQRFTGGLIGGEDARLEALRSLEMLDSPRDDNLDRITELMMRTFGTVASHMVLIDPERCWLKSWHGIWRDFEIEGGRLNSFKCGREEGWCNYIFVSTAAELLVIEDSLRDARVSQNPFVVGPPYLRFYAGAPLVGSRGERYGTLCVADLVPRCFPAEKYALLVNFAAIAVEEIERNKPLHDRVADAQLNVVELSRHLDLSLQASREGMLMFDARDSSWPIVYANEAFAEASGLALEVLTGGCFWDLFHRGSKTRVEVSLPAGNGDTFEMRVACKTCKQELSLRFLPAVSDRFAPSKATGIPAWAPFVDSRTGGMIDPSPGGSEGAIGDKDVVDDVKCFWFAVVCAVTELTEEQLRAKQAMDGSSDRDSVAPHSSSASTEAGSTPASECREETKESSVASTVASSGYDSAYCEYHVPRELQLQEVGPLLGSGSFGKVFRATTATGGAAALKVVDCRRRDDDSIQAQLREIQLSSKLDHPGVVKIFAYATTADVASGRPLDVLWCTQELCELGTLTLAVERGWFREQRNMASAADMPVVWRVLLDLASAMAYVHGRSVIHGDLTGRNVLLTGSPEGPSRFVAKICDLGLARYTYGHSFATDVLGTITHMAPELLQINDPTLTFASDVWAFGVIAWEIYHGKCAYKGKNAAQIVVAVARKRLLTWPADAPEAFVGLMKECLSFEHSERPGFPAICKRIESTMEQAAHAASGSALAEEQQQEAAAAPPTPTAASARCLL